MACQHYTKQNLVYRVYHPTFYTKRSLGAIYREYRLANLKYKLPTYPKKPHKSRAGRGKSRGLDKTAPPFIGGEIGKKKSKKNKKGNSNNTRSTRLVFT